MRQFSPFLFIQVILKNILPKNKKKFFFKNPHWNNESVW